MTFPEVRRNISLRLVLLIFLIGVIGLTELPTKANANVYAEFQETPAGSIAVRNFSVFWGASGRVLTHDFYGVTNLDLSYSYPASNGCGYERYEVELLTPGGETIASNTISAPGLTGGTNFTLSFPTILMLAEFPLDDQRISIIWTCTWHNGLRPVTFTENVQGTINFAAPDIPSVSNLTIHKSNSGKKKQVIFEWDPLYAITGMSGGETVYYYRFSKKNARSTFGPWQTSDLPLAYKKLAKKSKYSFQVQIVTPYGYSEIKTVKFKT